uniref:Secreted protein n=1 Tax=Oryza brachyantha TaxID=4533 RepID=J3L225_ORYBR
MPPLFTQEVLLILLLSILKAIAFSGGDIDFRTRVLFAFINCAAGRTAEAAHRHENFSNPRTRNPWRSSNAVRPCSNCQSAAAATVLQLDTDPRYMAYQGRKGNCVSIQRPPSAGIHFRPRLVPKFFFEKHHIKSLNI